MCASIRFGPGLTWQDGQPVALSIKTFKVRNQHTSHGRNLQYCYWVFCNVFCLNRVGSEFKNSKIPGNLRIYSQNTHTCCRAPMSSKRSKHLPPRGEIKTACQVLRQLCAADPSLAAFKEVRQAVGPYFQRRVKELTASIHRRLKVSAGVTKNTRRRQFDELDRNAVAATGMRRSRRELVQAAIRDNPALGPSAKFLGHDGCVTDAVPLLLLENSPPSPVLRLKSHRLCYVCKTPFLELHHYYDSLCTPCAALSWNKRHQTRDLTGQVAVVTGGRIKIGACALFPCARRVQVLITITPQGFVLRSSCCAAARWCWLPPALRRTRWLGTPPRQTRTSGFLDCTFTS